MEKAPIPLYKYVICPIEKTTPKNNIFQLLAFSLQTIFSQIILFLHIFIYFILGKRKYYFKNFSPYKQCRLAKEYSQVAGLVVSWGRRAKLLSITSENSIDSAYCLKRATQSVPQLRHLSLITSFGANYNKLQVIFLNISPYISNNLFMCLQAI